MENIREFFTEDEKRFLDNLGQSLMKLEKSLEVEGVEATRKKIDDLIDTIPKEKFLESLEYIDEYVLNHIDK